ncbi:sulfatase family protein [Ilumatobacter nonamiensis]|uniref:sulfatase family protein n=1 Tax=Ilumatobacter nonamiensis TaxID=467093 RepID=UPI0003456A7B|nr:sulfatase-like hydrolase/transferase [Ilumatobacter nonamiensis]
MSDPAARPNVLFIITDQHRADHVGFMGNPVVRTPHLDALAARGTVFESAWVSNPVCMPNRSTLITGRMPSNHGVITNDRSLEWGANTYVRRFRAEGYRTALLGKSHLQNGISRLTSRGSHDEPSMVDPWPAGWNELEFAEHFLDGDPDWPDDFYGFDTVELSLNHGAAVEGHHYQWAMERGARHDDLVVPQTADNPKARGGDPWWQVYDPPYGEEFHSSSFVADRTINFIEEAAEEGSPWLAWASFPDPHHPFTPPGQWYDRHDAADMELPATFDDPMDGAPEYLKMAQKMSVHDMNQWVALTGATSPEVTRAAMAANYGTIEMIDDRVGQILATIERLGQTDDTIVVFTADHGDMMGDHHLLLKGFMHYRGCVQVPMLIADPRRTPGRSSSLISSIDLPSTLLDMCEIDGYHGIQGVSQTPVLDDPTASVRDAVLIEDDMDIPRMGPFPTSIRTLITPTHRYSRYDTGEDQVYELGTDDDERINLAAADPQLRSDLIEQLTDTMIAHTDKARAAHAVAAN